MTDIAMTDYYARRAAEYERIYSKPERQEDLKTLRAKIAEVATGRHLLEIACGTGYWTQCAAQTAKSILATDYNEEVMAVARSKDYGPCAVTFRREDAYALNGVDGSFDGALVCFWWSHVLEADIGTFLRTLHSRLNDGARVLVLDNRYVEGSSTPISRIDNQGNTYQTRPLSDGSTHEVLKNFPTRERFIEHVAPFSSQCLFTQLEYFWLAQYTLSV